MILNNLGLTLQTRFERAGDLGGLGDAITAIEQAANAVPVVDHHHYGAYQSNLGGALLTRFRYLRALADLNGGIEWRVRWPRTLWRHSR